MRIRTTKNSIYLQAPATNYYDPPEKKKKKKSQ